MSHPHNEHDLGKPFRNKKKRSAVFIVIVISIAVHVMGGGVLAVIKIAEALKEEPEFEAPPVVASEPPPPPPPPPPTARRTQRSMPRPQPLAAQNPQNIDVPAIEINNADLNMVTGRGIGGGLGEIGGGTLDQVNITAFGFDQALEGTLTGTLYDFKTDADGEPIKRSWDMANFSEVINKFSPSIKEFSRNFNTSKLNRNFFRAEKKLYGSYFVIPWGPASIAPKSFGVEGVIAPSLIGCHYKGSYKPSETGRFRFFGRADDVVIVRVNGRVVFDGSIGIAQGQSYSSWRQSSSARKHDEDEGVRTYFRLPNHFQGKTGDWFQLVEGQKTDVEIFIAEVPGGDFGAYLLIEKQGVPGLKIFSTRPLSDQDKNFLRGLHPDAGQFL